ncbi:hypothetical protein AMTR_s00009p00269060 [Amborella trichopoda]|uniref:Uncharacterized protein n=1 Tax=Amborella trichopoda TaxID=13333 RepID=W1NJ59_AMBTC|nr:hypothetical protein AMTR_s00009p00269060 [Amborella trichopoda]
MPCLCRLRISRLWRMSRLPQGFQHLTTFQALNLPSTGDEFMEWLRNEERYEVEHILLIQVWQKTTEGWQITTL